ncbi:MAG: nitroreductase family protein [Gammaproteobacteria bacterium]
MELTEVMRTTFAAREFTDEPVTDTLLYRILDNARFAPSGGNRQGWKVIVIRDRAMRRALAALGAPAMKLYAAQVRAGENPWNTIYESKVTQAEADAQPLAYPLIENLEKMPVVLVVCVDLGVVTAFDRHQSRIGVVPGASIYPFVWNILLAARDEGLGGVLTTFLASEERRAQELLNLPEHFAIAALVPLGRPVRQLTRLKRNAVESFTCVDRWEGEPFKV